MDGKGRRYEIKVRGRIEPRWADWLEGVEARREGGDTALLLRVADNAAFYGAIRALGGLDLEIVSLRLLDSEREGGGAAGDGASPPVRQGGRDEGF